MTYSLVEMSVLLSCFFKFDSLRIMFGNKKTPLLWYRNWRNILWFILSFVLGIYKSTDFLANQHGRHIDICFIYHLFYRLFLLAIDISRLGFCDLGLLFPILFPYPPLLIFPIPRSLPCVLFTIHNSLFSLFWTRDSLFFILYSSFSVL